MCKLIHFYQKSHDKGDKMHVFNQDYRVKHNSTITDQSHYQNNLVKIFSQLEDLNFDEKI